MTPTMTRATIGPWQAVKRTYNLDPRTVHAVRELADRFGVATSQDAVVELAVDELRCLIAEREESAAWERASTDPEWLAESRDLEEAYRSADLETWPADPFCASRLRWATPIIADFDPVVGHDKPGQHAARTRCLVRAVPSLRTPDRLSHHGRSSRCPATRATSPFAAGHRAGQTRDGVIVCSQVRNDLLGAGAPSAGGPPDPWRCAAAGFAMRWPITWACMFQPWSTAPYAQKARRFDRLIDCVRPLCLIRQGIHRHPRLRTPRRWPAQASRELSRFPAEYEAGICNIGPEEIARRRRAGHFGGAITVGMLIGLIVIGAPPLLRLALFIPGAGCRIGLPPGVPEVLRRVGWLGVYNFGRLGTTTKIADDAARAVDRRKANQIGLASGLIGLAVAVVAVLLPV